MTLIDEQITVADAQLHRRLRAAGVAALLAAALGSVWSASPLAPAPSSDRDCTMQVALAGGFSSGCDDGRTPSSAP